MAEAAAGRCWPLGPLVARNAAGVLRERLVADPAVLRDLALIGALRA
jgi:hypothetical protein